MTRLPDFLVIGAAKCGTTSLASYLSAHDNVFMAKPKELRFFSHNWERGVDWYAKHFDDAPLDCTLGEASPQYAQAPVIPGVVERVAAVLPDARLVYLVRDPIEQMRSYYRHRYSRGRETAKTFDSGVRDNPIYLAAASYGFQIGLYLENFAIDQMLILDSERLMTSRRETMQEVFQFVGVRGLVPQEALEQELNRGVEKEFLPEYLSSPRRIWSASSPVTGRIPRKWREALRRRFSRAPTAESLQLSPVMRRWVGAKLERDMEMLNEYAGGTLTHSVSRWLEGMRIAG